MAAIESPMLFHPGTIDQPGKQIAQSLHGRWGGGAYDFAVADVWMFVGTNPIVTMWGGLTITDPVRVLREARQRGMRMIVVDPRRTELAAMADLHIRPRPGEDATLLAGLTQLALASGRYDRAFVSEHVVGVEALGRALTPFQPAYVESRTGVTERDQRAVVEMLLSSRRGCITAGTGANMTPDGTLTESLVIALHTLCGYWRRAGERVGNPGVLVADRPFRAQAEPAAPALGAEIMRSRPLRSTSAGMPTAALADEMLLDSPDRVRAFLNLGGNPVAAWPDQLKTIAAMRALDLLVCFDVRMSATGRYADYVFGSKFALEVPQVTGSERSINAYGAASSLFQVPYAMYSPAIVPTPPGSELVEEWEVLLAVAARLGLTLSVNGSHLLPGERPTTDDLLDLIFGGTRISLDEVRGHEHGHVFDGGEVKIEAPAASGQGLRLQVDHPLVLEALKTLVARPHPAVSYPFRLISRRTRNFKNSSGLDIETLRGSLGVNPAFMNPGDLSDLSLLEGDAIEIRSARSSIKAVVGRDPTVPSGVISMTHACGDGPDRDDEFIEIGSCTGRLVDNTREFDRVTGMPQMTAIPVSVCRVPSTPV
jgi:anaerobic selenocysteine-containing dehydrogenase